MKIKKVPNSPEPKTLHNIAYAYQQAFGHAPWNEGYTCSRCSAKYPLNLNPTECTNCGPNGKIEEYWPQDKIIHDFCREMNRPDAICFVAEDNNNVVGFAWGYMVSMCKKTSSRLHAPSLDSIVNGDVFYLDEIAVIPTYQGRGIGKQMMEKITPKYKTSLLRTLASSPMQRLARSMGWQTIMEIQGNRVIMSVNTK